MQVILIRVAIDQSCGHWNGPCNPHNRDFVYVPIPQMNRANVPGLEKRYTYCIAPALQAFSKRNGYDVPLPTHLRGQRMHLDPDFDYLTYGDTASRGRRLLKFVEDDVVVFYGSLRSIIDGKLIYALIGLLVVQDIAQVRDIVPQRFDENAHTRNLAPEPTDVVARGKRDGSGRFEKYIPIGEFRDRAYRVQRPLLDAWGGLSVRNGYLQRSANPPLFPKPKRFLHWLQRQNPRLTPVNNP